MEGKERFLTALKLKQPDRVPVFDFLFCQGIFENVLGRKPESYNARDVVECALKLGLDAIWVPMGGFSGYTPTFIDEKTYIDEWGTTFRKETVSWPIDAPVDYPIKNESDLDSFKLPDPTDPNRVAEIRLGKELGGNQLAIVAGIQGPLTTSWFLMGIDRISFYLYDNPDFVRKVFDMSNKFYAEAAKRLADAGADAIIISEDMGYDTSLFFSPQHTREFILPCLKQLVDTVHAKGLPVILHCDGNINSIFGDIVDLGFDAVHPLERKAGMKLKTLKEKYGDRICLIGNVDSSSTLPYGTPEEVEREVLECIRDGAANGGYVLASDHSLHDGIGMVNIYKMLEAARKFGKYPNKS